MSVAVIRALLEQRVAAMTPALATAYENVPFTPPAASVPYQRAYVLLATPDNLEQGPRYREQGYAQVTLCYPLQAGSAAATARAKLVRDQFPKALSLSSGGVVVTINKTPAIGNGTPDGDRWSLIVKIPFHVNLA